jgi:probable HAF family extracellular repeat protein
MIDLGALVGNTYSIAHAINDSGQIVGEANLPGIGTHAVLWEDGSMTDLGAPVGSTYSAAYAINDAGQIVGLAQFPGSGYHAVLWEDGAITDLGTSGGVTYSIAYDINDAGQIVGDAFFAGIGFHAALWEDGSITNLGTSGDSTARAINDAGQIVGQSFLPGIGYRAVVWEDGSITNLGILGGGAGIASDINAAGQVVGMNTGTSRAFIAARDTAPVANNDTYTVYVNTPITIPAPGVLGNDTDADGDALTARPERAWPPGVVLNSDGSFTYTPAPDFYGTYSFWYSASDDLLGSNVASVVLTVVSPYLIDLGTQNGGRSSDALVVNDAGQVAGWSYLANSDNYHGVFWDDGEKFEIPTFGGANSNVNDINELGQVVGLADGDSPLGTYHAFLWENGVRTDLHDQYSFPGRSSEALEINDAGQIAGWAYLPGSSDYRGFFLDNGVVSEIYLAGSRFTNVKDMNESGQVVGHSFVSASENLYHAFLWEDGDITDLGTLNGGRSSEAIAINDSGQVVGWSYLPGSDNYHAVLWQNDDMPVDLSPYGSIISYASDINERGQVVGYYQTANGYTRAFLWENGTPIDLGTLPGGNNSYALGINEAGQVVGYASTPNGEHAFIWQADVMIDLGTFGGYNSRAYDINNAGEVIGHADLPDSTYHAFITTPFNAPPEVFDDAYSMDEDTTMNIPAPGVLGNDTDREGDTLTAVLDYAPLGLVLNSDGSFSYTPPPDFNGSGGIFTYRADDGNQQSLVATVRLTVNPVNDVPVVDAGLDATLVEGDTYRSGGTSSDVDSELSQLSATVDYGDGSGVQTLPLVFGKTFTLNHTYADSGIYIVAVTVTDDEGASTTDTVTVIVNNIAPTVTDASLSPSTLDEGESISGSGSFTDPGADTWTATADYGDGSGPQPVTLNPDKTFSFSHTYSDNGTYDVVVTVTDDDGGTGSSAAMSVTVNNIAPSVSASLTSGMINEGDSASGSGTISDPSSDTWTATANYGDGSGDLPVMLNADKTFSFSHAYDDNGVYLVVVTVSDDDGGSGSSTTMIVTVNNVAPTVSASLTSETINEGDTASGSGTISEPGGDTLSATVDYGDGSGVQPLALVVNTFSLSHTYADNGVYTITVAVTDDDGGTGSTTLAITVDNVAPDVSASMATPTINAGQTATGSGSFTDPGSDTWSALVNYGEGGGMMPLTLSGNTFSLSHTYNTAGTYNITIRISDDDGGVGIRVVTVTVSNNHHDAVQAIVNDLTAVCNAGRINRSTCTSLSSVLQAALRLVDLGFNEAAATVLDAFNSVIRVLMAIRRVPRTDGQRLINETQAVINALRN